MSLTDPDWRKSARQFGSVVMLSTADYDAPLWTNKQHIASRLAPDIQTLYIDSLGMRRPRLSPADLRRIGSRAVRAARSVPCFRPASFEGPQRSSPLVIPAHGFRSVRRINRRLLRLQLEEAIVRLPTPRILWSYTPLAAELLPMTHFDIVLYHCVDDLASIPGISYSLVSDLESSFVPRADVVVTTAPALRDRLITLNANTHYFHNVTDVAHFAQAREPGPIPGDLLSTPAPRAIFVGALSDHKIDWPLVVDLATLAPEWSFVFIGPIGAETHQRSIAPATNLPNIRFLGHRPYSALPDYLRGAEVGLVPYLLTEHTNGVFPMKVMEYRAAGLPVIATPLSALNGYADSDRGVLTARRAPDLARILKTRSFQDTNPNSLTTWNDLLSRIFALLLASRESRTL